MSTKNGVAIFIDRKSVRPFYDSEWEIRVSKFESEFTCNIIRMDDETAINLANIIHQTPHENITKEFIMGLDQKNKIFYD